jgi:hypothetical protein
LLASGLPIFKDTEHNEMGFDIQIMISLSW